MQDTSSLRNTLSLSPIDQGKKIIFACGRLIYYKGFHNLIDAAEFLPDCCSVRIAGEGALRVKLEKQIKIKGLEDKVFLLGRISDEQIDRELNDCFLFCLPSTHRAEMYAVVQVEAFCHGKPVISTNIPRSGVPEVNLDGVTGFTVEVNNPKAIADKITLLLNDGALYARLCENARNRGRELTDKNIVDKYIKIFSSL